MNMTVSSSGATIELDCATAEIGKQLRKARSGSFQATGTLTHDGPGPIRIDRAPKARNIVLKGKISGDKFTITIKDAETGEELGAYSLTKGKTGRLRRCL